jgi:hypothetical protein
MFSPSTSDRMAWTYSARRDTRGADEALHARLMAADVGGVVVAPAVALAGVRRKADVILTAHVALDAELRERG